MLDQFVGQVIQALGHGQLQAGLEDTLGLTRQPARGLAPQGGAAVGGFLRTVNEITGSGTFTDLNNAASMGDIVGLLDKGRD